MGQFIDFIATQCDVLHIELEAHGGQASRRVRTDRSKMVVEVRTAGHLALIEIWEHANCLDVTVLETHTSQSTSLSAGPCATESEATSRIEALRSLLQSASGTHSQANS